MADSKNRLMPLIVASARFADVAEMIASRLATDEILRDLCEDYNVARAMLTKLKKERPERSAEIDEYTCFVSELEDEILRHLLGPQERTDG